jgi:hypothetical protein
MLHTYKCRSWDRKVLVSRFQVPYKLEFQFQLYICWMFSQKLHVKYLIINIDIREFISSSISCLQIIWLDWYFYFFIPKSVSLALTGAERDIETSKRFSNFKSLFHWKIEYNNISKCWVLQSDDHCLECGTWGIRTDEEFYFCEGSWGLVQHHMQFSASVDKTISLSSLHSKI